MSDAFSQVCRTSKKIHEPREFNENWRLEYARQYLGDIILPWGIVARANAAAADLSNIIESGEVVPAEIMGRVGDEIASLPADRDVGGSAQLL